MSTREKSAKTWLYQIKEELLGIAYPPRCPGCDCLLLPGGLICPECDREIRRLSEPVCKRCGKALADERREYCHDCQGRRHSFRQGKAVFVYEKKMKLSMYRFKYSNKREYAAFYAREAVRCYGEWIDRKGIEVIVPIPMYAGKKRLRGYNQAEVFARALARETGLPMDAGMVIRNRDTIPQKELNDRERRQNLKNAFQFVPNIVKYKKVMLVDDIYTTGSTMDAVAEVLLAAGIGEVYYLCVSIGVGA